MPAHKIILGIDFGTTYSGVAWASNISPKEISPIRQWPNAVGKFDMDKVPSEMVYLPDGTFKWGFQTSPESIRKDGKLLQYMKLLLDPSQEIGNPLVDPLGLQQVRSFLPPNKKPVDVVADYLRAIKTHALDVLSNSFGTKFWKVIDIEYHVTIPAVWSESAKALTLMAAHAAGIGSSKDLILIAEPEAAALYCLTDSYPGLLKVGDTFTVADCGGGTVDLISYKVLATEPKFEVKEVAVGGGLCGSVFLNRRFEAFIRKRLGTATVDTMIRKGKPYYKMMKEFDERLKRTFQDTKDQEVMDCEVPGLLDDPRTRVEDGFIEIDRVEMREIFDPVIKEILRLIKEQFDTVSMGRHNSVSSILLVGGFGSSPYLYKRVQAYTKTLPGLSKDFKVLQPANAWSAVARGAVICGLQNIQIQSRQARRNYGVYVNSIFDSRVHPVHDKYWCHLKEEWRARDCVQWFVKKGDEVVETKKIKFPFYVVFQKKDTQLHHHITLLASNTDRLQAETCSNHPNVFRVCVLKCKLKPLFKHLITSRNSQGLKYYTLNSPMEIKSQF